MTKKVDHDQEIIDQADLLMATDPSLTRPERKALREEQWAAYCHRAAAQAAENKKGCGEEAARMLVVVLAAGYLLARVITNL